VLSVAPHEPSIQPPHTIISLPVHTALCHSRALGALVKLVAVHVFVFGLKRPPVMDGPKPVTPPPQMISSVPLHTPEKPLRASGALSTTVLTQLSVAGA
jgi:hypothetical protein